MKQQQTQKSTQKNHPKNKGEASERDIEICTECISLMKTTAEKCRSWSKESESAICRGGLATSAFVCEGIARSMEECMSQIKKDHH